MKVEEFIEMPMDQKTNYLWDRGQCIFQETIQDGYSVCVFELEDFYVEAVFSKHKILKIRHMAEITNFEAYVDSVTNAILNSN